MFKLTNIFKNKKQDPGLAKQYIVELNTLEQKQQTSEDKLYELPSANEGQVSIHLTGISPTDGGLLVGFFVSNGLNKKIKCDNVSLVLIDSNKRILAKQSFDGEIIGEIVGGSTKACVAHFLPKSVFVQGVPTEGCQVCFDIS